MKRGFGILTVVLVLVIFFCIKGTVMSKGNQERAQQNHYYAVLEQDYLEKARVLMLEEGFVDCGINLTRVTYEDGRREYTVRLHHRRFDRLPEEEMSRLKCMLSDAEFQDESCSFYYEMPGT